MKKSTKEKIIKKANSLNAKKNRFKIHFGLKFAL